MKKREKALRKRKHRILKKKGAKHFANQRFKLSDLPPKSEWGSKEDFELRTRTGRARCQDFSKQRIFEGYRDFEAQCPKPSVSGYKYCKDHLGTKKKRYVKTKLMESNVVPVVAELKRYEKYLPKYVLTKFLEAANDPNKLSNEVEIDLVTARLSEVLGRLNTKQSDLAWQQVRDAHGMIDAAIKNGDIPSMKMGLDLLKKAIGQSDYPIWRDVIHLIQNRSRLVGEENTRILKTAEVINVQELMAVIAKTQEIIFSVVTDKKQQWQIAELMRAEILEPEPQFLPEKKPVPSEKDIAKWTQTTRKACRLCSNDQFRVRNYKDGEYKCPQCGTLWQEKDDPAIIEGEAHEV